MPDAYRAGEVIEGDWDDVRVAAGAGASAIEAAIERIEMDGELARFELVTIGSEPGVLEVTRVGEGSVTATARVGFFGDASREARLLDAFAHRLGQLHGVAYAPR